MLNSVISHMKYAGKTQIKMVWSVTGGMIIIVPAASSAVFA
jgi:hypothetical protein